MSHGERNRPMDVRPFPDPLDPELEPLIAEPFARAWALPANQTSDTSALRERLLGRVAASHAAEAGLVTVRRSRAARVAVAPGVMAQALYEADRRRALRPGEPLRARLIEMAPGSEFAPEGVLTQREWLVLDGEVRCHGVTLAPRDYRVLPAGHDDAPWSTKQGALVFLRESALATRPEDHPRNVLDAEAGWSDFAPGVKRRVLWQRDGQAAMLYHASPGARVPNHVHGHDEECLMVQGDLFLDDLLLRPGDYQLAPAGSGHRVTETDTGVVIYAHGDLDLQFVA